MIRKINKKMFFGLSVIVGGLLSLVFAFSKRTDLNLLSLITEVPLGSIERVSASDGAGDCCGSSTGGWDPGSTSSGVGILIRDHASGGGGGGGGGGGDGWDVSSH